MSLLQATHIFVIVFYNYTYCSAFPASSAKNTLITKENVETPTSPFQSQTVFKEIIPFKNSLFSSEGSTSSNRENKILTNSSENETGHRVPKFFGRLAFLAGPGLSEVSNSGLFTNLNSINHRNPATFNLPQMNAKPYFAAIYDPFFAFLQPYFYSNLLGLLSLYNGINSQKLHQESNIPPEDLPDSFTSTDETNHDVENEEYSEEYKKEVENRNDHDILQGRINDKQIINVKQTNLTKEIALEENTSLNATKGKQEQNIESTESTKRTEVNRGSFDPVNQNYELKTELLPPKSSKPHVSFEEINQNSERGPTTTRKQINTTHFSNTTQINSTHSKNTTHPNMQNPPNGYPYSPGYYEGNPQNINDLYITTSQNLVEHENYKEISPHYSEHSLNNGNPSLSNFIDIYPPFNSELQSYDLGESTIDDMFFRPSPELETATALEPFINNGFRPSRRFPNQA